ncbi:DUF3617 domain-containing protein [Phenylobacterium sp.]|uniref:DUF3617 domain-containing protein n=1 Tax=Phenylobacterium sp. TaxID=1871053 RepID=UPI0035B20AE9
MKRLAPALLACVLAAPLAAAAAETPIAPGYWETTSQVVSPFPTKKTEKRCIREQDVEKFIGGAPNRHYTCTYPTREIAGGKIRLAGSCKTKNSEPVPISGEGVYTRDSLRLDARIRAKLGGITVPVHARTSGRRIADACPAEAEAK